MAKKKNNELFDPTSPYLAALAVGTKFALEGVAGSAIGASALFASPALLATVCAAGAFMVGKMLVGSSEENEEKAVREMLERTRMNVKVDKKGQVSTTVSTKPSDTDNKSKSESVPAEVSQDHPVVIEEKNGTKIYQIQNLNIYLKTEIVHQLNLNPKEVINQLAQIDIEDNGRKE